MAAELFYHDKIVAFIGPACTYAVEPTSLMASYWDIPLITGLGDNGKFKNKTIYTTMTRMSFCQCRIRRVLSSVFHYYHWKNISLIYDVSDANSDVLGNSLKDGLVKSGFEPNVISFNGIFNTSLRYYLQSASSRSRSK
uniref:Receptor ligand binding region domain-containing protein n=1 Tax=Octopus bimaculoides TaxID=37653 RepID=A0A0L8GAR7_OCTBM